ncbi:unnamed protein product, partial [Closterium sp. Yama58-4]
QALLALNSEWGVWPQYNSTDVFCDEWEDSSFSRLECNTRGMVTALFVSPDDRSIPNGVVPSAITALSALQKLELPLCAFTGSLEFLGQLPRLEIVDLHATGLSGSIPESIGNATNLKHLDLTDIADLTGSLPSTFSRLTALTYLSIGRSQYNDYSDLIVVDAYFVTKKPPEIHSITDNMKPPVLQGSMDDLSSLAPLTRLQHLALMTLNLTAGELPSSLSALTSLTTLDLRFLSVTRLPQWITSLPNLVTLDVTGNFNVHRSAPFPTEWMALTGLETLQAGLNGFTGSIPSTISALTGLGNLGLSFNNLTGAVPAIFDTTLQTLDLSHNHLTIIPTDPNLGHNDSEPSFPFNPVYKIDLSHNPLSEGLDRLFTQSWLLGIILYVGSCNFSGPFPSYPGKTFYVLDVSNNSFTGPFPSVFLNEEDIADINLSHNNFTGPLPPDLANSYFFKTFNVSYNHFNGIVPRGIWALEFLTSLRAACARRYAPIVPSDYCQILKEVLYMQELSFHIGVASRSTIPIPCIQCLYAVSCKAMHSLALFLTLLHGKPNRYKCLSCKAMHSLALSPSLRHGTFDRYKCFAAAPVSRKHRTFCFLEARVLGSSPCQSDVPERLWLGADLSSRRQ